MKLQANSLLTLPVQLLENQVASLQAQYQTIQLGINQAHLGMADPALLHAESMEYQLESHAVKLNQDQLDQSKQLVIRFDKFELNMRVENIYIQRHVQHLWLYRQPQQLIGQQLF